MPAHPSVLALWDCNVSLTGMVAFAIICSHGALCSYEDLTAGGRRHAMCSWRRARRLMAACQTLLGRLPGNLMGLPTRQQAPMRTQAVE